MKRLIIAIDGPAAAGKSTAGKALAARLGYLYIDTGALYRAVAWLTERDGLVDSPGPVLGAMVRNADIRLEGNPQRPRVLVEGRDVSVRDSHRTRQSALLAPLRGPGGARGAAGPAAATRRRRRGRHGRPRHRHRDLPRRRREVLRLRLPGGTRTPALHDELLTKGVDADPEQVLAELEERDRRDSGRKHAPLKAADDAVSIDTTDLDPEAVLARMLSMVESRL